MGSKNDVILLGDIEVDETCTAESRLNLTSSVAIMIDLSMREDVAHRKVRLLIPWNEIVIPLFNHKAIRLVSYLEVYDVYG